MSQPCQKAKYWSVFNNLQDTEFSIADIVSSNYLDVYHVNTPNGVEIYNAANKANMNALAFEYALGLGLPVTAGSDIHFYNDNDMGGMLFEKKIKSIADYVEAIKSNSGIPVRRSPDGTITPVSEIKEQTVPTELPTLPVLYPEGK